MTITPNPPDPTNADRPAAPQPPPTPSAPVHPAPIPPQRTSDTVVLRGAPPGTDPRAHRVSATGSLSHPATPTALDPTTSPLAQSLAFGDRILADDDRTRRARSLLDPFLGWSIAVITAAMGGLLLLIFAGITCLAAGLAGLGPAEGHLLLALGVAGLGVGTITGGLVVAGLRAGWGALRHRYGPSTSPTAPSTNSANPDRP